MQKASNKNLEAFFIMLLLVSTHFRDQLLTPHFCNKPMVFLFVTSETFF